VSWLRVLLDNWEELLAAGMLLVIGCAMVLQVLLRTAFGAPLEWPEELSQFLLVWASVLGGVGAIKRAALVRVDYLLERLSPPIRALVEWGICIAICAILGILGWMGWQLASRTSTVATALPITWAWAYAAAPVLAVLAIVRLLQVQALGYRFAFFEVEVLNRPLVAAEAERVAGPAGHP